MNSGQDKAMQQKYPERGDERRQVGSNKKSPFHAASLPLSMTALLM